MSGITGYISTTPVDPLILEKMLKAIEHRGRDGQYMYHTENLGLGFCDHKVRHTGSEIEDNTLYLDRYVVIADARLYNYIELMDELIAVGYGFSTTNESEIIAASYDYWGPECLNKFNGPLALFLYDTHMQEYFLARDRFGKKPFYYYKDSEQFVFGSEIKAIYASGLVPVAINEEYLNNYLLDGPKEYLPSTAFKDISRFPIASYFKGTLEQLCSTMSVNKYWRLSINKSREVFRPEKARAYAVQYYDLLNDAVKVRMRTDCEVGAALSGGLDSSSIAYLVKKELERQNRPDKLETFSTIYKTPGTEDCDESRYINLMAEALGVNSNQIEPVIEDIPKEHEKVIWAMENPPESTCMSGWHTFKLINNKGVKVTLDGQGADEQLAGYLLYIPAYLTSLSLRDFYKEFTKLWRIPGSKKQVVYAFLLTHYSLIFGKRVTQKTVKFLLKRDAPKHLAEELQKSMEQGLVTLLHYADHTAAAHSVESRMPFMDYRLVEFLASIPASYKMHNGWTKYIARLAFDKKLPKEICWRKDKMGWPIPEEYWFSGPLQDWLAEVVDIESNVTLKQRIRLLNMKRLLRIFIHENK